MQTTLRLAKGFPIVAITGPRQSGKTTLARAAFPGLPYLSLEDPDTREFALADPRGFLARFSEGAVLDYAATVANPELGGYEWEYVPEEMYYLVVAGYAGTPATAPEFELLVEQASP